MSYGTPPPGGGMGGPGGKGEGVLAGMLEDADVLSQKNVFIWAGAGTGTGMVAGAGVSAEPGAGTGTGLGIRSDAAAAADGRQQKRSKLSGNH